MEWVIWPKLSGGSEIGTPFSQVSNSWAIHHPPENPFLLWSPGALLCQFPSSPVPPISIISMTAGFSTLNWGIFLLSLQADGQKEQSSLPLFTVTSWHQYCKTHRKSGTHPQDHDSAIFKLLIPIESYPWGKKWIDNSMVLLLFISSRISRPDWSDSRWVLLCFGAPVAAVKCCGSQDSRCPGTAKGV